MKRISKGKMLLEEARVDYKKGEYLKSNRKLTDSEYLLTTSFRKCDHKPEKLFQLLSRPGKNGSMQLSKNRKEMVDYSIIIDKFSRKCFDLPEQRSKNMSLC